MAGMKQGMRQLGDHGLEKARRLKAGAMNTLGIGGDESWEQLLEKIEEKDDFHRKRMRCITNPERAFETLKPYAELQLTIVCARNLQKRSTWVSSSEVDAFVTVFVDDVPLEGQGITTMVVHSHSNPLWNHSMKVGVVSPMSMIRLQVYDHQGGNQVESGFVEFCVGDVPFNTDISGWLELRFQENLKSVASQRYASHMTMREEEVAYSPEPNSDSVQSVPTSSKIQATLTRDDFKARKQVAQRVVAKARTMMDGCSAGCTKPGARNPAEHDRGNAGELFVTMRFERRVSGVDAAFALAVDPPAEKHYGNVVVEDEDPEAGKRKTLDLQRCMDTFTDARLRLFEDFVFCIYYWVLYVGSWRNTCISLPLTLGFFMCALHGYYTVIMFPFTLSLVLVLNAFDNLRRSMTRGGFNAMMSNDGFKRVAAWRSTEEMRIYLKRLVENDLNGTVTDMAKLRTLAATCFRDGVPTLELDELKTLLKKQKDTISFDWEHEGKFSKGDKVIVKERNKATVLSTTAQHVYVEYDDPADDTAAPPVTQLPNSTVPPGGAPLRVGVPVALKDVRPRPKISFYHTWLLPTKLVNAIVDAEETADQLERSSLYPTLALVTDIFIWKKKAIAMGIILGCVVIIALFVAINVMYEDPNDNGKVGETIAWAVITAMRNVDNLIALVLVFLVFVMNAKWFQVVLAMGKVFGRLGKDHLRSAPACWAFYQADDDLKEQLSRLPKAQSARSRMPDFSQVHSQLSKIPRLSMFKPPDPSHPHNLPPELNKAS